VPTKTLIFSPNVNTFARQTKFGLSNSISNDSGFATDEWNDSMELAHDTTTQEYVEVIHDLERANKVARVKDIAEKRGVTRSSVSLVLNQLVKKELIAHEQYGHVTLTETGQSLASSLERRHRIIKGFLVSALGIPEEVAESDACKLEHHVSDESLAAFVRFLSFIENCPHIMQSTMPFFAANCTYVIGADHCNQCTWPKTGNDSIE